MFRSDVRYPMDDNMLFITCGDFRFNPRQVLSSNSFYFNHVRPESTGSQLFSNQLGFANFGTPGHLDWYGIFIEFCLLINFPVLDGCVLLCGISDVLCLDFLVIIVMSWIARRSFPCLPLRFRM